MKLNKKGVTLIEIMIIVAILGILAAIAIPQFAVLIVNSKREKAGLPKLTSEQVQACTEQKNCDTYVPPTPSQVVENERRSHGQYTDSHDSTSSHKILDCQCRQLRSGLECECREIE